MSIRISRRTVVQAAALSAVSPWAFAQGKIGRAHV